MGLSHYYRRGVIVSTDRETGQVTETKLRRCVHCQHTWAVVPGSGKLRGFCQNCMGDLCGQPACVARGCLNWEAELDLSAKGISLDSAPISAPTGGGILLG